MAELTDTQRFSAQEEFAAAIACLLAGRMDGLQAVATVTAVHERFLREHVTAALDEIERRIDQSGVRNDSAERWGIITALHIVRGYRQEQDR